MRLDELHLGTRSPVAVVAGAHDFVPRLREPLAIDEAYAGDDAVIVGRFPFRLRFELPHTRRLRVLAREALAELVQIAFPDPSVVGPLAGVGQRDEQHPSDDFGLWDGAQRLLQAGARAAREFQHLAALAVGPRFLPSDVPTAQLRTGAAFGCGDSALRLRGEVWTVDKPTARRGARRRAEQDQRTVDRPFRDAFRMSPVLWQEWTLSLASIRGPPVRAGGLSRLENVTPAAALAATLPCFPKGLHDMKQRLTIDGAAHSGGYRVDCECGDNWSGIGERIGEHNHSPALPIAECVVHVRLCHSVAELDLRFTSRFESWLEHYWNSVNLRAMRSTPPSTFGTTRGVPR